MREINNDDSKSNAQMLLEQFRLGSKFSAGAREDDAALDENYVAVGESRNSGEVFVDDNRGDAEFVRRKAVAASLISEYTETAFGLCRLSSSRRLYKSLSPL